MIGVNFQPGSQDFGQNSGNAKPSSGSGVQEAIRVLSLRLPKVQGANAAIPMPLMTSQGSGGNPRVDSVVQQVLSRIPQQQPRQSMQAPTAPNFSGMGMEPSYQPPMPMLGTAPRVVIESPMNPGDFTVGQDGRPMGSVPGAIGQLPANFQIPQAPEPQNDPWQSLQRLLGTQTYPSSPNEREDVPLF